MQSPIGGREAFIVTEPSLAFRFLVVLPVLDRTLLISWLLKDFGWMTTNYYLGFPFGCVCVVSHLIMFVADPRPSFRYYNLSLLLWVCGNFLWMSSEFLYTSPSSSVHFGPSVPLQDPTAASSAGVVNIMKFFKAVLFLAGVLVQFVFYVGIVSGRVNMPDDDEDDVGVATSRNELLELLGMRSPGSVSPHSPPDDSSRGRSHSLVSEQGLGGDGNHDDLDYVGQSLHGEALTQLSGFVHGIADTMDLSRHNAMQFLSPASVAPDNAEKGTTAVSPAPAPVPHPPPPPPLSSATTGEQREMDRASPAAANKNGTDAVDADAPPSPTSPGRPSSSCITLVFVENMYIVFWLMKDFFWSWGTGDFTKGLTSAIFYESCAIFMGMVSFLMFAVTTYLYRTNFVRLVDSLTTLCWIAANFVWMSGEFFIRYRNLQLDDGNEDNDGSTRIVSACLFTGGILLQLAMMVFVVSRGLRLSHWQWRYRRYKRGEDVMHFREHEQQQKDKNLYTQENKQQDDVEEARGQPGRLNKSRAVVTLQFPPLTPSNIDFTNVVSGGSTEESETKPFN